MEIKTHPIYDLYEFNSNGQYRLIGTEKWMDGIYEGLKRYLQCNIRNKDESKTLLIHRAMWETFKGEIPNGHEIDHLDSIKTNNKLNNLECVTMSENRKRSQKNNQSFRDCAKKAHGLKKSIKGINIETNDEKYFKSKSQTAKYYGCSPALVYLICEGKNNAKTFKNKFKFEYCENIDDEKLININDARLGKSKYTDEEKILKKKEQNLKSKEKKRLEKINKI